MRRRTQPDILMPRFDRHRSNNPMNGLLRLSPMQAWSEKRSSSSVSAPLGLDEDRYSYEISVELPQMTRNDLEVEVYDNGLVIRAVSASSPDDSFEHTMALPDDVDVDHVDARFKDGVLTIVLPKRDTSRPASLNG